MSRKKPFLFTSTAFICALLMLNSCARHRSPQKDFPVMGTIASVTLPPNTTNDIEHVTSLVMEVFSGIEHDFSIYRPESEISRINASAGQSPETVSANTINLLQIARYYSEISDGALDITVMPFMKAWGLADRSNPPKHPPEDEKLRELSQIVNWRHIELSDDKVFLKKAGMFIDVGGIAKGYALDVAFHKLISAGISRALIDLGGNIRCLGAGRDNGKWIIGVRNPYNPNRMLGTLQLESGEAVATSGNYERFVTIAGKRYSHIIDPQTGRPTRDMASVTVLSHSAVEADALSTILFVQGAEDGIITLGKTSSKAVMLIPDKQPMKILMTPEFAERFTPDPAIKKNIIKIGEDNKHRGE